jgi:hypothetical protein
MAKNLPVIGIEQAELPWVRTLISLLRHPDPVVPELARETLRYLSDGAEEYFSSQLQPPDLISIDSISAEPYVRPKNLVS